MGLSPGMTKRPSIGVRAFSHSNALSTFGGGPGTVGLHGWPNPSVFGHAVSNGCVRVPAAALHLLSGIPLGTLVLITR